MSYAHDLSNSHKIYMILNLVDTIKQLSAIKEGLYQQKAEL